LGAGELRDEEDFALADIGFGGDLRIASNFDPLTLSLIIFRGRGPSELIMLELLSGGCGRLFVFAGGPIVVVETFETGGKQSLSAGPEGATGAATTKAGGAGNALGFCFSSRSLPVCLNLRIPLPRLSTFQ